MFFLLMAILIICDSQTFEFQFINLNNLIKNIYEAFRKFFGTSQTWSKWQIIITTVVIIMCFHLTLKLVLEIWPEFQLWSTHGIEVAYVTTEISTIQ